MNKVLYWYIHAAVRGRFTSSTETTLAQDYDAVERNGVDGLINSLERWRGGSLSVNPHDFEAATLGSRFYPLLYMLTRVKGALDFGTGLPLSHGMLGALANLQVHHIFPKALLYQHGHKRDEVNAIANFCLLTQESNLRIGKRSPAEYLAGVRAKHPGAIASQWLPEDPSLWNVERYREFLAARRELLASAANELLNDLRGGVTMPIQPTADRVVVALDDADDARAQEVHKLVEFLVDEGFTQPVLDAEIIDPSGEGRYSRSPRHTGPTACNRGVAIRWCWNSTRTATWRVWRASATKCLRPWRHCGGWYSAEMRKLRGLSDLIRNDQARGIWRTPRQWAGNMRAPRPARRLDLAGCRAAR